MTFSFSVFRGPVFVFAACTSYATAQEASAPSMLAPVVVSGRADSAVGMADSATEGTISAQQLANRPLLRAAEVLESVPGMIVTQHSGDGKANQYFLRGFNLDHGSDFASFIEGMPVNMVTHGHGQGYSDLNFLIPELIATMRYDKGLYGVRDGDFAVAGTARIDYVREVPAPFVDLTVGGHGYQRLLTAGSKTVGANLRLLTALEAGKNEGPWEQPERLHKLNGVLRLTGGMPGNGFSVTGMAYSTRWTATEQVPQRAIDGVHIPLKTATHPGSKPPAIAIQKQHRFRFGEGQ